MSCPNCQTTAAGTVVCDPCAAQMIEATSSLLKNDQYATLLPGMLTPSEVEGMRSVVSSYFSDLVASTQQNGGLR